jgi:hypothetical protein
MFVWEVETYDGEYTASLYIIAKDVRMAPDENMADVLMVDGIPVLGAMVTGVKKMSASKEATALRSVFVYDAGRSAVQLKRKMEGK